MSVYLGHPLMSACQKFVTRHKPLSQREWLKRIEGVPEIELDIDLYGNGPAIDALEEKIAELLGKEKALFFHKGMVGQHSALLSWSRRSGHSKIAIHPQSHMQVDEELAYKELLGLDAVMFGKSGRAIDMQDIKCLPADLSVVTVELPVRRAGFKLPEWSDLERLKQFSLDQNIPLHIDGARLLEAAHYWNKPYRDVAAMGDSVYVSLYKTLGAAAGGIIAGDASFIKDLMPWRSRLGGDLYTAFPYALTALWGLNHYLPRIPEFHQRAQRLSKRIREAFGANAIPDTVQCYAFVVELPIAAQKLRQKALDIAKSEKIWLFDRVFEAGPGASRFEIQVGDALDDWTDEELVDKLRSLID